MGLLKGSSPMNLLPTIERHPRTRFVLFHGGYPWTSEVAALSHDHGNVYPDLAWLPLISTSAAARALTEWLEVCPSSARIAWGGDCWTSEESFAAALAFRHVLKEALSRLVRGGMMTASRAEVVARKLAHENAGVLYGLGIDG
jgi:predicted TIM-barrel fold metal-dependent hydrolase